MGQPKIVEAMGYPWEEAAAAMVTVMGSTRRDARIRWYHWRHGPGLQAKSCADNFSKKKGAPSFSAVVVMRKSKALGRVGHVMVARIPGNAFTETTRILPFFSSCISSLSSLCILDWEALAGSLQASPGFTGLLDSCP